MSSTTLAVLLRDLVEEYGLGKAGVMTAVGSTSTVVDATNFAGPFAGNEWIRGSSLRVTSGNRIGQTRPISDYAPSTGTFTFLTANVFTGSAFAANDTFVIVRGDVLDEGGSIDRIIEAFNRFLTRYAERRMRVPLTFVPNGDLLATSASTGWTATNATGVYVELAHPDGYYFRVLQNTSSSSNGRLTSTTLKATPGDTWNLYTFNRVTAAGDIAELVIQDETNGAAITPAVTAGDTTYSGLAFQDLRCTFTIPSTCYQISIRLQSTASGDVSQWGPIVAAPQHTLAYTGQTALEYLKRVTGLWTHSIPSNGPQERLWMPVEYGRQAEQFGWGQGFTFEAAPPFPLYADMTMGYPELSADTDTTACPAPLALAGGALEFFRWAHRRERQMRGPDSAQTRWGGLLNDAEVALASAQSSWGAPRKPSVRKHFAGGATA